MVVGLRQDERLLSATGAISALADVAMLVRPRLDLFGVHIDRVTRAAARERICEFVESGAPHQIVTVNLDFLYLAERDAEFRATINEADLAVADGMPLVWVSHLLGTPLPGRVTGVELADECCRLAASMGEGVFLLGGAPGVAEIAAAHARERYPGLRVSSYAPPVGPITPEEDERMVERVYRARPTFLLVALGAPRQDLWIREHLDILGVPVSIGVGCVVDLMAGTSRRAPSWMQSTGFEWSYRLMREPGRLWKRYLLDDLPLFARLWLRALTDVRSPRQVAELRVDGRAG